MRATFSLWIDKLRGVPPEFVIKAEGTPEYIEHQKMTPIELAGSSYYRSMGSGIVGGINEATFAPMKNQSNGSRYISCSEKTW